MNPTNIFINSQNVQPFSKKPEESDSFLHPLQVETKIISPIPEHSVNFPFKVIQDEKNSNIPNNFFSCLKNYEPIVKLEINTNDELNK